MKVRRRLLQLVELALGQGRQVGRFQGRQDGQRQGRQVRLRLLPLWRRHLLDVVLELALGQGDFGGWHGGEGPQREAETPQQEGRTPVSRGG